MENTPTMKKPVHFTKAINFTVFHKKHNKYAAPVELLEDSIDLARSECIQKEYSSKFSDNEILGILISKHAKWDLENLTQIFKYALEDSNMNFKDLKNYLEGPN